MISYNEINTLNILNHDNYAHVQKEGRVFVFVGVAEFELVFEWVSGMAWPSWGNDSLARFQDKVISTKNSVLRSSYILYI